MSMGSKHWTIHVEFSKNQEQFNGVLMRKQVYTMKARKIIIEFCRQYMHWLKTISYPNFSFQEKTERYLVVPEKVITCLNSIK